MKIEIKTKYKIGQSVYYVSKGTLSYCQNDAYIYKLTINAICITDNNCNYMYQTYKGLVLENQLFDKLKEAKEYAQKQGYTKIKYIN